MQKQNQGVKAQVTVGAEASLNPQAVAHS